MKVLSSTVLVWLFLSAKLLYAQEIQSVQYTDSSGFEISGFSVRDNPSFSLGSSIPFFSFNLNDSLIYSDGYSLQQLSGILEITISPQAGSGSVFTLTFRNKSDDTLRISNVVPMGEDPGHVYLTEYGPERLSKTKLYVPGRAPLSVIVPDNAWELGYSSISINNEVGVYSLARRQEVNEGSRHRFWTDLFPGGGVSYTIWVDIYSGSWQEGLRKCFQEKLLYDLDKLEKFDDTLYHRPDLAWIRDAWVIHLIMAWDHHFYDASKGKYMLDDFIRRGKKWYGGDDVIGIWPTWPTLGLDQRNQWDLYKDLPGGLSGLRTLSYNLKEAGTRLFISYNPWDESTRKEDQLEGMADLIRKTDADGVVLDTRGSSSRELQEAADGVKEGVIMYSEGMAVPRDMPGIISGRVHNALYYPPILNLNKLIRPDFAIFRVAELTYERIRREYALAFFNGYGTEINMFKPGQPEWIEEDYRFLGRTSRILRENSDNFFTPDWTPMVSTRVDSIYVNKWPGEEKTLYTIFSLHPEGYRGPLIEVQKKDGYHFHDLWNHEEVQMETNKEGEFLVVDLASFDRKYLGTNNEGAVGCIIEVPEYLTLTDTTGGVKITSTHKGEIRVWKGMPDYEKQPVVLLAGVSIFNPGRYEGKLVVQLFEGEKLLDARSIFLKPGKPRLISKPEVTKRYKKPPAGMIEVPSGNFRPEFIDGDSFIYYPEYVRNEGNEGNEGNEEIEMQGVFIDKFPVTNAMFREFLLSSNYTPEDTTNFLKHWKNKKVPVGLENTPVVYVSPEDARAYARWAGKRLPTEMEWQYTAQTEDHLKWPWGNRYDSLKCNPGNGTIDPVGRYPQGANPLGIQDLVGNVWQLTADTYESGSYTYTILKGGSFFKPTTSWWYVQGGPHELMYRQILLHVSDGFERNATVGFRCVADKKNE